MSDSVGSELHDAQTPLTPLPELPGVRTRAPSLDSRGLFDSRGLWLGLGLVAGLVVAQLWPSEPALATATDRSDQFAVCVGPSNISQPSDALYTLDFLTGDLKGAAINPSNAKFTQFFYRNIMADFGLDPTVKAKWTIVAGNTTLNSGGGGTAAPTVLYVSELNSGLVVAYGYATQESQVPLGVKPFLPLDRFRFRVPVEKE
jgi:hypothetical protein